MASNERQMARRPGPAMMNNARDPGIVPHASYQPGGQGFESVGCEAPRSPAVPSLLNDQTMLIDAAHEALSRLEERISTVLRPCPPNDPSGPETPVPLQCNLANGLTNHNQLLRGLLRRFEAIQERIDI